MYYKRIYPGETEDCLIEVGLGLRYMPATSAWQKHVSLHQFPSNNRKWR